MNDTKPKVLVVVGPTASGKTGVAIELAKQFDGEVISADSRQVYRGMDIGTAKVTEEEMQGVPHHLLDVADPSELYTAADFKRDGEKALQDILKRGKLPIIAGGTFFYVDALLGKLTLPKVAPNLELRAELEDKDVAELLEQLKQLDPKRAEAVEPDNKRRIIRAIEIATELGEVPTIPEEELIYDTLSIGLSVDMESHGDVIKQRLIERLSQGMLDEVKGLLQNGVTHDRLEGFGLEYRYLSYYLQGKMDYDKMVDELAIKTRQYAKRQLTWLKRDQSIQWFDKGDSKIFTSVEKFLHN